jgi:hypothetical protein
MLSKKQKRERKTKRGGGRRKALKLKIGEQVKIVGQGGPARAGVVMILSGSKAIATDGKKVYLVDASSKDITGIRKLSLDERYDILKKRIEKGFFAHLVWPNPLTKGNTSEDIVDRLQSLREEDEQVYQYLDIGEIRGEEFMEDLIEKLKAKKKI